MRIRNFGAISILCLLLFTPSARSQFTFEPYSPPPIREHNLVWVVTDKGVNATGTAFTDPELKQINDACTRLGNALTSMRDLNESAQEALDALQLVRDRAKQTNVEALSWRGVRGYSASPMFHYGSWSLSSERYELRNNLPKPVGVIQINTDNLSQSIGENIGRQLAQIRLNLGIVDDSEWAKIEQNIIGKVAREEIIESQFAQCIFWFGMNPEEQEYMLKLERGTQEAAYEQEWHHLLAEHNEEQASSTPPM